MWPSVYPDDPARETAANQDAGGLAIYEWPLAAARCDLVRCVCASRLELDPHLCARALEKPKPDGAVVIVELDAMWHDVQKNGKNSGAGKRWMRLRVDGSTGNVAAVTQPR
jgi:hypothetical protein